MDPVPTTVLLADESPDSLPEARRDGSPLNSSGHLKAIPLLHYLTFVCVGASFLWPWNCYLTATAYFTSRFAGHPMLQQNFSSAVMTTTTLTGTVLSVVLAHRQKNVNYNNRVLYGELIICVQFVLVAVFCIWDLPATLYFTLVLVTLFCSTIGSSLTQNGSLAICNTLPSKYMQANTVGQAISGVMAPMVSLLSMATMSTTAKSSSASSSDGQSPEAPASSTLSSALYFVSGSVLCALTYFLFRWLTSSGDLGNVCADETYEQAANLPAGPPNSHNDDDVYDQFQAQEPSFAEYSADEVIVPLTAPHVPLSVLFHKLVFPAATAFVTFAVTLIYPIFADVVVSSSGISRAIFVPLVYLFWNVGDLSGRYACGHHVFLITNPRTMVIYSWCRVLFLPVFLMCNINGNAGAFIRSDFAYLLVHYLFGFTNGQLLTSSLVAVPNYVLPHEKEPAGGFMMLCLSLGLATGSLFSFFLAWFVRGY